MPLPKLRPHNSQEELIQWAGALTRQLDRVQQVVANGQVTLAVGQTETTIFDQAMELGAEVFFQARNTSAGTLASTSPGIVVTAIGDGFVTFEYPTAVGDEIFAYGVIGPGGAGDDQ